MSTKSVTLLASGGIDSTALLDFYKRNGYDVTCVHFQYGQPSESSEFEAVKQVCERYSSHLVITRLGFGLMLVGDEVMLRNTIFVVAAAAMRPSPKRISLGIHRGSPYYDCTPSFLADVQRVLDGYFAGTVRLEAPFIDFGKDDIIRYAKQRKIPLSLTYSCLRKNAPECGECQACKDRRLVHEL